MGVHDWSRADDGLFHDFHNRWIGHLTEAMNDRELKGGYYARSEQYFGRPVADILTLFDQPDVGSNGQVSSSEPPGGVAVATAPPKVRIATTIEAGGGLLQRTLVVRHTSGNRVIAVVEVVSGGNQDDRDAVTMFVDKIVATLRAGIHVVVLDLIPPTPLVDRGFHAAISRAFHSRRMETDFQPTDRPVALLSYCAAGRQIPAYLEFLSVGEELPEMPLFLTTERYVNLPLAETYTATYRGLSPVDRRRIDS